MIFVASLRRCGRSRLLLAQKRNRIKNSKDHFTNPSWYPELLNPVQQDTTTTQKIELRDHGATEGAASVEIEDECSVVNFLTDATPWMMSSDVSSCGGERYIRRYDDEDDEIKIQGMQS